jgi:exonuclease VII small subunit
MDLSDVLGDITFNPLSLLDGMIQSVNLPSIADEVKEKDKWVENKEKRWWKPWTWFDDEGHWTYKKVKYVDGSEFAGIHAKIIQQCLFDDGEGARKQAETQSEKIARRFGKEFEEINARLEKIVAKLERLANDKENADKNVAEFEGRLAWLKDIKGRLDGILEI